MILYFNIKFVFISDFLKKKKKNIHNHLLCVSNCNVCIHPVFPPTTQLHLKYSQKEYERSGLISLLNNVCLHCLLQVTEV